MRGKLTESDFEYWTKQNFPTTEITKFVMNLTYVGTDVKIVITD